MPRSCQKTFFSCFSLCHDEAREILLDQVMDCFIHSGLSRANGMPGSLKEETYCCLRKCWQDALVVKFCNHLFFLARKGARGSNDQFERALRSAPNPDISRFACCDHGYGCPPGRPRELLPTTYLSSTPRDQLPAVSRWHTHLRGLATAIRETTGLRHEG
jgi:hypothetical protein